MRMSSSLSVVSSSSISSFPVGGHATKRIQNFGRSGMKERFFFQRVRLAVSGRPSIRARLSVQSLRTKVSNTAMRSKILSSSLPAFDCAGAGPLHLVRIFMPTSNVTFSFFFLFRAAALHFAPSLLETSYDRLAAPWPLRIWILFPKKPSRIIATRARKGDHVQTRYRTR